MDDDSPTSPWKYGSQSTCWYCDHQLEDVEDEKDDSHELWNGMVCCDQCYKRHWLWCHCCESERQRIGPSKLTKEGAEICDECSYQHYIECALCDGAVNAPAIREVSGDSESICETCAANCLTCDQCQL